MDTHQISREQVGSGSTQHASVERTILNIIIKDKIINEKVRETNKIKDIITKVENSRGKWAGHVTRMQDVK